MGWKRSSRAYPVAFVAVLATVFAAGGATVAATPIDTGPSRLSVKSSATIFPKVLPKTKPAPASLRTGVTIWTSDDSGIPPLKELQVGFDRHLRLELENTPACRGGGRDIKGAGPEKTCPDSVVGAGRLAVETRFRHQDPVRLSSELTIFKGPSRGRAETLYIHAEFPAPIVAVILAPMEIEPVVGDRVYGLEGTVELPKIAGGYGSVTHIGLRFRKGVFTATCPRRRLLQIQHRGFFVDGQRFMSTTPRFCG